jgi:uncharacterized protein YkuJ
MLSFVSLAASLLAPVLTSITFQYHAPCFDEYGSYNFVTNTLTVCEVAYTDKQVALTVAHELIHAAQDAFDGIDNKTIVPLLSDTQYEELLKTKRGQSIQAMLDAEYPEYAHRVEFEAWYFEGVFAQSLRK